MIAGGASAQTTHPLKATGDGMLLGSVEDGVEWLRAKGLLIHPRCERAKREARLYRYKTNKAGDVLAQIEDAENHVMDAVRYAFAPLIRRGGSVGRIEVRY